MPNGRTLRSLSKELIDNPFLPLLFISEAIKQFTLNGYTHDFRLLVGLSVCSVALWILSDAIDVEEDIIGNEES